MTGAEVVSDDGLVAAVWFWVVSLAAVEVVSGEGLVAAVWFWAVSLAAVEVVSDDGLAAAVWLWAGAGSLAAVELVVVEELPVCVPPVLDVV